MTPRVKEKEIFFFKEKFILKNLRNPGLCLLMINTFLFNFFVNFSSDALLKSIIVLNNVRPKGWGVLQICQSFHNNAL